MKIRTRVFQSFAGFALISLAVILASPNAGATAHKQDDTTFHALGADASVYAFGNAPYAGAPTNERVIGITSTHSGNGYWIAAPNGGVFSYGDAAFYGSMSNLHKPVVGIATTVSGNGYWLVASDGGVFSFGDATFYGSTGAITLNQPIVGMAVTPSGHGYWLVAKDGGVFSFGDATFYGSTGGVTLNKPVVGITAATSGNGYWLVAQDGGVFSFGSATFYGSAAGVSTQNVVGMTRAPSGNGYLMAAADGGVFAFGGATFRGSGAGQLDNPAVGFASNPSGSGYWILASPAPVTQSERALEAPEPTAHIAGQNVVYSNSMQRVWLIADDGTVVDSYLISGKQGVPAPGFYAVHRKINPGRAGNLILDYFVGFAYGSTTDIGFHGIPHTSDGTPIESNEELGQFRSHGCVRQAESDAIIMWNFAYVGMPVVVTP